MIAAAAAFPCIIASAGAQGTPKPPSIDTFFGCSDVVAIARVESAQFEQSGTIYRAHVLAAYKGTAENQTLYFVARPGSKVGGAVLFFLQKSQLNVAQYILNAVNDPAKNIFHDVQEPIYVPLQNGNALLNCDIPEELVTVNDATSGKFWVHVPTAAITLPAGLLSKALYQPGLANSFSEVVQYRWVPAEEMANYLALDAKRNLTCSGDAMNLRIGQAPMATNEPAQQQSAQQQPAQQQPAQQPASAQPGETTSSTIPPEQPEMTADGARVVHSLEALPPAIQNALVSHIYNRLGDSATKHLTIDRILIYDSAASAARGIKRVRTYVAKALYIDSTVGVLGLPLSVGLSSVGKVLDPIGFPDMAHDPSKRKIVPPQEAFATAAKQIKEGTPLPSYMEYDPSSGSLIWKFRWSNPKNEAMYREVDINAHTGKFLQTFLHNMPQE